MLIKKIGKTAAWPQHNGVCMWAHTHTHTHTFSLSILSFILFGEIISDVGLQNYPHCNNLLCLSLSVEKTFLTFCKSIIPHTAEPWWAGLKVWWEEVSRNLHGNPFPGLLLPSGCANNLLSSRAIIPGIRHKMSAMTCTPILYQFF